MLDSSNLKKIEERFGTPKVFDITQIIGETEMRTLRSSMRGGRDHDVTIFIKNPEGEIAVIRKPFYPPGAFRAPSGGIKLHEDFEKGALREAWEETGLEATLEKYLLRINAKFTSLIGSERWTTHVFSGRTNGMTVNPIDTEEIAEARFATIHEINSSMKDALLSTGRGLLEYRVRLTDETIRLIAPNL